MEFSTRGMRLLIQKQGNKRVSTEAAVALGEHLEWYAGDVAELAVAIAYVEGSRVVRKRHIHRALRK